MIVFKRQFCSSTYQPIRFWITITAQAQVSPRVQRMFLPYLSSHRPFETDQNPIRQCHDLIDYQPAVTPISKKRPPRGRTGKCDDKATATYVGANYVSGY